MAKPTGSTEPDQAAAAGQACAASVRRVVDEAARSTPRQPGCWLPVTLARVALAEAAGLLPRRPETRRLPPPTAEPADQHQPAARGTADEHDHDQ